MLTLLTGFALGCSLLGHAGHIFWLFDILAQFQVFAAGGGLLLLGLARWQKNRRAMACAFLTVLSGLMAIMPTGYGMLKHQGSAETSALKVISFNVDAANQNRDGVTIWLQQQQPDILGLIEANAGWNDVADRLRAEMPHQLRIDNPGNFGIMVLSRYPLREARRLDTGPYALPFILAQVETPQGLLRVLVCHTMPPLGAYNTGARNAALRELSDVLASGPVLPTLVMGDFNAVPWSPPLRAVAKTHTLQGFTLLPSWPDKLFPAGIPIDHVLGMNGAQTDHHTLGPQLGSDHRPVLADVVIDQDWPAELSHITKDQK